MSTYEAKARLEPNKPVDILEYDEHGNLVGAYKGYWNFGRQTVALYPNFRNPFVRWRGTPTKRVVSDRLIKRKAQNAQRRTGEGSASRRSSRDEGIENSTRKIRKLPIVGQIKIEG